MMLEITRNEGGAKERVGDRDEGGRTEGQFGV
jgi:hypothetical protein